MRLSTFELNSQFGDVLTWRECLTPPSWLTWELCQTVASRARVRDWFERGGPTAPALDFDSALLQLHFDGCRLMHQETARVLVTLPPPVQSYVLRRATFLGIGPEMMGSCGGRPSFDDRPWVIELSGPWRSHWRDETQQKIRHVIAHEIAHAWQLEEPPVTRTATFTSFEWETLFQIPIDQLPREHQDKVIRMRRTMALIEFQCEALVRSWGY